MKILHITPSSDGYEEVTLIANRYSRKNQLALIEKNGEFFITGGFLIEDTAITRNTLDQIPKSLQYEFMKHIRTEPFAKAYYNEEEH